MELMKEIERYQSANEQEATRCAPPRSRGWWSAFTKNWQANAFTTEKSPKAIAFGDFFDTK